MKNSSGRTILSVLFLISLIVSVALAVPLTSSELLFKNRQGPPSEFELHNLPSPRQVSQSSDSALLPIHLTKEDNQLVWRGKLPVDSTESVTISLLGVLAKQLTLKVSEGEKMLETNGWIGFNDHHGVPSKTYIFEKMTPGLQEFEITCPEDTPEVAYLNGMQPHLQLLIYNESPLRIQTSLTTYNLQVDEEFGLVAMLYEGRSDKSASLPEGVSPKPIRLGDLPNPLGSNSIHADMEIIMPDGEEKIINMRDDGFGADLYSNDGIFAASMKATQPGTYVVQVVMRAEIDMNEPGSNKAKPLSLLRTSQHVITVVDDALTLKPAAKAAIRNDDEMIDIVMTATPYTNATFGRKFVAYAEVWGTSTENEEEYVPVAWVNGMTMAEQNGDDLELKLKMSAKWLALAKATLPLKLKNLYVLDVDSSVPVSTLAETDEMDVQSPFTFTAAKDLLATHPLFQNPDGVITETMKVGPRPAQLVHSVRNAKNSGHKVLLVHGYCSNNNPFSTEDFTNYAEFLDAKKSRSNDEFAQLIAEFSKDFESISIVAHSQGGLASLHMLNFYWTHMDNAKSTDKYRVIQSVGSPYRGTALAGSLASIGKFFDVGCGSNTDLTHDGAERWLATISQDARQNVYYHTSKYGGSWSWCNLAANAVLSFPNDGTTEYKYSNLKGATEVNHLEGWCHSVDMKFPPQCTNHEQNQVMNSFAHPQ